MLSVIMLNVIILNVVMLNVVAPLKPQTVLKTMSSCVFKAIERNIFHGIDDNYFDTFTYFLIIIWTSEFSKNGYANRIGPYRSVLGRSHCACWPQSLDGS
jgi:hypothetical protein